MTQYRLALLLITVGIVPTWGDARTQKGVMYADTNTSVETSLDVYAPPSGDNLPVICWIHGGGWQFGSKERVDLKKDALNEKGMVLVSINYRLHPKADYKGQAGDVAQAIRWVKTHAKEFGGSPELIFVMGHSAGAHLAALVSTDERYLKEQGLTLKDIRGAILLDGAAYDIPRQIELAALPRMKNMYETVFTKDQKKQRDASPITHVKKGKSIPPFLIVHIVSRRDGRIQSESLAHAINDVGGSAEVISEPNKTHATINRELGQAGDLPTKHVFQFLDKHIPSEDALSTK